MTDSLRRMFEDASREAPPDLLDLDAVMVRARGVRRRRRVGAASSLAVLALAVVIVPQLTTGGLYELSADSAAVEEAGGPAEADAPAPGTVLDQSDQSNAEAVPFAEANRLPSGELSGDAEYAGAGFSADDAAGVALTELPAGYERADADALSWVDGSLTIPLVGPTNQVGELVISVTPCVATSSGLDLSDEALAAVEDAVCAAYVEAGSPDLP